MNPIKVRSVRFRRYFGIVTVFAAIPFSCKKEEPKGETLTETTSVSGSGGVTATR